MLQLLKGEEADLFAAVYIFINLNSKPSELENKTTGINTTRTVKEQVKTDQ